MTVVDAEFFKAAVKPLTESFLESTELDENVHTTTDLLALLNNQLQQWQALADSASDCNLPGLMDVFGIFNESLTELIAKDQWLSEQEWEFLDQWYSYVDVFFNNLDKDECVVQLLTCLACLASEDIDELRVSLHDDALTLLATKNTPIALAAAQESHTDESVEPVLSAHKPVQSTLVNLISTELSFFIQEFTESIELAVGVNCEAYQSALINKANKFHNLQQACKTVGLIGLQDVFLHLQDNIHAKSGQNYDAQQEAKLFKSTVLLIQDYLDHINDPDKQHILISFLQMEGWRLPLSAQQAERVSALLTVNIDSHGCSVQRIIAAPEDTSLDIAKDVNKDLLGSVLHELPLLTESFAKAIHHIVSEHAHSDYLLEAQRIAHTLKGTAGMVGVAGITKLTHGLEDILEKLTEKSVLPPKALSEVLLDSADCLESMSEALCAEGVAPDNALTIIQSVLDWHYQIEKEGIPEDNERLLNIVKPAKNETVSADQSGVSEEQLNQPADTKISVSSVLIDQLMQSIGEQGIVNEQLKEKTDKLITDAKNIRKITWQLHELSSDIDRLINIQNYTMTQQSLNNTEFDTLEMDQFNEFHGYVNHLAEMSADIREMNGTMSQELLDLKSMLLEQNAMQKDNLETTHEIRLVPVQKIISRCQRIVRQTAKMIDKKVDLHVSGELTMIDSETLNNLVEPLMHLLRNSVDHGIESSEVRQGLGKAEQGHISLTFSKQGNFLHISCLDDGGGLDKAKIIATALKRNLMSAAEIEQMSDHDISRLIITPGFSTRETTTQISGRGIGMDVINSQVKAMKGTMEISSTAQLGMQIDIALPLLLVSNRAILVKIGGTVFAIAEQGVKQIFSAVDAHIISKNKQHRYQYEEQNYALEHLGTLLGLALTDDLNKPALLIEDSSGKQTAVLVDAILGTQDLVIKSLGEYVPYIPGILGAAILGSGEVATVVNAYELLSVQHELHFDSSKLAVTESIVALPKALVIDDSLSARKAAAQLMQDNGFDINTAIDGLDAIEKLEQNSPDIILVDMEMPRMNGLEFTRHIRKREDISSVPIIMITSRSTDKHRDQARQAGVTRYLTKPVSDDELINAVNVVLEEPA